MEKKNSVTRKLVVNSEAHTIFSVLADVEKWNEWTKSITSISFLEKERFVVGGKARILQPRLSPAIWTITEIVENKSFTWKTKTLGVIITAMHTLESSPVGTVVELRLIYEGFLSGLLFAISSKKAAQNLELEINGLKSKCEMIG